MQVGLIVARVLLEDSWSGPFNFVQVHRVPSFDVAVLLLKTYLSALNVLDLKFIVPPLGRAIAWLKYLGQRISAVHLAWLG